MFHILGGCYLQEKNPDILVFRPSSQRVEKLESRNYFLFCMEVNRRYTSWLHVTCLSTASRTEYSIFYSSVLQKDRISYVTILLIYGKASLLLVNVDKTLMIRLKAMGRSFPISKSHAQTHEKVRRQRCSQSANPMEGTWKLLQFQASTLSAGRVEMSLTAGTFMVTHCSCVSMHRRGPLLTLES